MKRLLLFVASLSVALILSEGLARVFAPVSAISFQYHFDSVLGPIPVPNERGIRAHPGLYSYTYSHNSLGLRGGEYGPKTRPRILILGDSFTYGVPVSDNETFSSVLQATLPQYEVINAGNPGQGTDYQLKFYRTLGRQFQPDIVVLCFVPNDFADNQRGWYYNERLEDVPMTVKPPLVTRSRLYSWFITHSALAKVARNALAGQLKSKPLDRNASLTRRYLSALNDDVRADSGRFFVFYIREWGKPSEDERAFMDITAEIGIDAGPFDIPASDYLSEGHWNAHGHTLAAQTIASVLIKHSVMNGDYVQRAR